jgi:N-dimethylarginine dimethylaminohydrolase
MIQPFINNEFSKIKLVVLGIGDNFGGCPLISNAYDPKSKEHIINGTFPKEGDVKNELQQFLNILNNHDVDVLRPRNIFNCNQIFTRDVGFVIEDCFFISNMIDQRKDEILGFEEILKNMHSSKIHKIPDELFVEGGDVIVSNNYVFVGVCKPKTFEKHQVSRTSYGILDYFSNKFPNKKVVGLELKKSDTNPRENCLHLDCCFQPLGLGHAIVYPEGFRSKSDFNLIETIFGADKLIIVNQDEMYNMFPNIFSISNNIIVSDKKFNRLNNLLIKKGYLVEEISFSEVSKMGGLFRCSTLPLLR